MRCAFTLLELLVVVSIIVVLLALLLPGMDKAMIEAEKAKCLTNLHAIGQAMALYTPDHQESYPAVMSNVSYHGLLGTAGTYGGVFIDTHQRPLNRYLGSGASQSQVKAGQCPSDMGDPLFPGSNAYRDWGTSYFTYIYSWSGIQRPYGFPGVAPMKTTQVRRMENKVLVPEWNLIFNRSWSEPTVRWHIPEATGNESVRHHMTLFANASAEFFEFDRLTAESDAAPPDPSRDWW